MSNAILLNMYTLIIQVNLVPFFLTTVITGMIVGTKLLAIVSSTHKISFTTSITIRLTSITPSITVSFSHITRISRGAASCYSLNISSHTSLTWRSVICLWFDIELGSWWFLAAVITFMKPGTKLFTIVPSTYKISFASIITIIFTSIKWSITVTLTFTTRILRGATSPKVISATTLFIFLVLFLLTVSLCIKPIDFWVR